MANKRFIYDEYGIVSADFVNIDLANDNRRFLNPYNIGQLTHPVAIKATEVAVHFFEQVRQELLRGCVARAEYLFCNRLTEPKELCFGFSEKGIVGKGIHELAQYVINQIYYIDNHLIHEIKRIEDIKLFVDNIGDDRVSDIYANVIRGVLLEYTEQQCNIYGIPLKLMQSKPFWDVTTSSWVKTNCLHFIWTGDGNIKLLVPKCFIGGTTFTYSKLNSKVILSEMAREELLNPDSSIIKLRKDKTQYVTKKDIRQQLSRNNITLNKEFARNFAISHKGCIEQLRDRMEEQRKKKGHK